MHLEKATSLTHSAYYPEVIKTPELIEASENNITGSWISESEDQLRRSDSEFMPSYVMTEETETSANEKPEKKKSRRSNKHKRNTSKCAPAPNAAAPSGLFSASVSHEISCPSAFSETSLTSSRFPDRANHPVSSDAKDGPENVRNRIVPSTSDRSFIRPGLNETTKDSCRPLCEQPVENSSSTSTSSTANDNALLRRFQDINFQEDSVSSTGCTPTPPIVLRNSLNSSLASASESRSQQVKNDINGSASFSVSSSQKYHHFKFHAFCTKYQCKKMHISLVQEENLVDKSSRIHSHS